MEYHDEEDSDESEEHCNHERFYRFGIFFVGSSNDKFISFREFISSLGNLSIEVGKKLGRIGRFISSGHDGDDSFLVDSRDRRNGFIEAFIYHIPEEYELSFIILDLEILDLVHSFYFVVCHPCTHHDLVRSSENLGRLESVNRFSEECCNLRDGEIIESELVVVELYEVLKRDCLSGSRDINCPWDRTHNRFQISKYFIKDSKVLSGNLDLKICSCWRSGFHFFDSDFYSRDFNIFDLCPESCCDIHTLLLSSVFFFYKIDGYSGKIIR